jgi:cellobiose phosphorylase
MWVHVDRHAPVKFAVLKLRNVSGRRRKLTATAFYEWVLGELRQPHAMHITTQLDPKTGALLVRNPWHRDFGERVAFMDVNQDNRSFSGDRGEFIGRNGTRSQPAAMGRTRLSGQVGAALDPGTAMQTLFELADQEQREIVFTMGVGRNTEETRGLVTRFRGSAAARKSLDVVWHFWSHTLGAVHVETPDVALNFLANGWLLYQTLSARIWGRSGFYQSGGAYGFRDQLQDLMALLHADAPMLREHLLTCASRQFPEGDVQHWWHPPSGRGVRTHFSDDFLWLPLATCRYVLGSGDTGVLDKPVKFLEGRQVNPDEEGYYDLPHVSEESAPLYEHCVRAIRRGLRYGAHGLPLMGCGDWNDGMNLVGAKGRGESVWLAFFQVEVLRQFARVARLRKDEIFARFCEEQVATLRHRVNLEGWDGEWYRRAYFDDGEPLGSRTNQECRIDALPQSWSVLSGAGEPERARQAMDAVYDHLVRHKEKLVQLFDPPFDRAIPNPGYIQGYLPGVRENGGQYTHAAVWSVMAFAAMGDAKRAWELMALINPVNHGRTQEEIDVYQVEPYVVAADVYRVPPHAGRGGWTWYTGSAGWMYRLILESLLGLRLEVDRLRFEPCLPADWPEVTIHYRYRETLHHIVFRRAGPGQTIRRVVVDGRENPDGILPLVDDHVVHHVEVELGDV